MWTLSGFVDEISEDFETQCSVAAGLGLKYVEIRSAWGVNILDLDDSPARDGAGDPGPARSQGLQHRLADREDLRRRGLRAAPRACSARGRRGENPWRAVHPALLVLHPTRVTTRRTTATRCSAVCVRSPTSARPPAWSSCTRTRRRSTATLPERCLDIIESVGSPNLRVAWDPANFVQVGVRPFTEGYAVAASPPRVHADQGRPRGRRDRDGRRRRRRPAGRDHPGARARTASTGSSPSSRTSATSTRSVASPAPSCSPARTPPSRGCCRTKESSTHDQRCNRDTTTGPSSPSSAPGSSASSTAR